MALLLCLASCAGGEPPAEMAHERTRTPIYTPAHDVQVRLDVAAIINGMAHAKLLALARCSQQETACR
jgi:hypothetical protein